MYEREDAIAEIPVRRLLGCQRNTLKLITSTNLSRNKQKKKQKQAGLTNKLMEQDKFR